MVALGLGGALAPLGIPGTRSFDPTYSGDLADGTGILEALSAIQVQSDVLIDVASLIAFMDGVHGKNVSLSVTVGVAQTEVVSYAPVIVDLLRLAPALIANQIASHTLTDGVTLAPDLLVALPLALADTVGTTPVLVAQEVLILAETLGVLPTLAAAASYNLTVTQALAFADSLANFFGVDASDTVSVAPVLTPAFYSYPALAETIGVAPVLTPTLLARVSIDEGVGITPELAINAIFSGTLLDGVELTAGYVAPDGSFTTWVMNTRTAAVTEYDNFVFNSFAKLGNKYIGASETGLYELLGDDDAGTDIVARIKGGLMQFGGTHLARLKAAYIATRGEEDFVLRIETGDGVIYNYAVSTRDMRSTKVHMGKGQRSRYFSFELISTGADFDLETIEFVPIMVQRRV